MKKISRAATPPDTKKCKVCGQTLRNDAFYRANNSRDGLDTHCKACRDTKNKKWRDPAHNPDIAAWHEKQRNKILMMQFNLTPADKLAILIFQHNVCAICKQPMKLPNCDHDHKTGQIRGYLCPMCNRALGRFRDSLERLRAAVEYMTNFPATRALGAPRYGLPGRVGTKKQRKLAKKLLKHPGQLLTESIPQA
jgi:hypothetical protein